MRRALLTLATYAASLIVTLFLAGTIVLVIAGPHAGLLPEWMELIVLVLGWLAVLGVPLFAARRVWRRLHKSG